MTELEVRRLGRTEMKPKALGLGGGHLAGPEQSDEVAIALVRGVIERGINFVDTSPAYGLSEQRIGMALAGGWAPSPPVVPPVAATSGNSCQWSCTC